MEKEILNKLKVSLDEIIFKNNDYKREKNKKAQISIDSSITRLKNNLISNYNLMEIDSYINLESYDTDFFIHEVQSLILDLEK